MTPATAISELLYPEGNSLKSTRPTGSRRPCTELKRTRSLRNCSSAPVLIDTNIWVGHFRHKNKHVSALLDAERVVMHPYIVAELALGGLGDRKMTLASLEALPELPLAELHEVRQLIEVQGLFTEGIGFVDAHLIASLIIVQTPTELWTEDDALARVAQKLVFLAKPPFAI